MSNEEEYPFVWEMIYYPLVLAMIFINCFADKEPIYTEGHSKSEVSRPQLFSLTALIKFIVLLTESMSGGSGFFPFIHHLQLVRRIGMERIQETLGNDRPLGFEHKG